MIFQPQLKKSLPVNCADVLHLIMDNYQPKSNSMFISNLKSKVVYNMVDGSHFKEQPDNWESHKLSSISFRNRNLVSPLIRFESHLSWGPNYLKC